MNNWILYSDVPFPPASINETRQFVVRTERGLYHAVHCAYDHTGEYQPPFGSEWYYQTDAGPQIIDIYEIEAYFEFSPKGAY